MDNDAHPPSPAAVLTDPGHRVPADGAGASPFTVGWLRHQVARFRDGAAHAGRRALAERQLNGLEAASVRAAAGARTREAVDAAAGRPFDAMALMARRIPGRVLADALGFGDAEAVPAALPAVAAAYQPGTPAGPASDAAVRTLARLAGPGPQQVVAARIGLLVQAYDATAGLIGNALVAGHGGGSGPAALIGHVLAHSPPVRRTRRITPDGRMVAVDLTGAPFGAGPHRCPGEVLARALAEGVVEVLLERCRLVGGEPVHLPGPVLRIPARLEMAAR